MENIQSQQQQDEFVPTLLTTSNSTFYPQMLSNQQKQSHGPGLLELQMIYSITFGLAFQTKGNQSVLNN